VKTPYLAVLLLIVYTNVEAEAPAITCIKPAAKPSKTTAKIATVVPAKEAFNQEFSISCGSQTANQSIREVATEKDTEHESSAFWIRFLEEIVKLIGSLAWPIAAVTIASYFKKEIANLLSRLKKGRWGDAEVEFENHVREVDSGIDIPRDEDSESISPEAAVRASTDPRGAIVGAWIAVEEALFELVKRIDRPFAISDSSSFRSQRRMTSTAAIRAVQSAGVLDTNWISLFFELRELRNEAAHSPDFEPSPQSVITYVRLAKELTNAIRTASNNIDHRPT
jgi:hypothetical protein